MRCRPPDPAGRVAGPAADTAPASEWPPTRITDDDDRRRRQRAKQYWPIRRASNNADSIHMADMAER